jgi:hypothetical protein
VPVSVRILLLLVVRSLVSFFYSLSEQVFRGANTLIQVLSTVSRVEFSHLLVLLVSRQRSSKLAFLWSQEKFQSERGEPQALWNVRSH